MAAAVATASATAVAAEVNDEERDTPTAPAATAAPAPAVEKPITFLYKLRPGACPKSYGMQVAELAGVPLIVIAGARRAAAAMEAKLAGVFGAALTAELTVGERSALASVLAAAGDGAGGVVDGEGSMRAIEPLWRDLQQQRSAAGEM
jgi:hypothetical protein